MGKEKLLLAAEAAGYAMVNPDDCETIAREPVVTDNPEQRPVVILKSVAAETAKPSLAQEWFSYFRALPAIR